MSQEIEYFRRTIIETCKPDLLEDYRLKQRTIQRAIRAFYEPSQYGKHDPTSGFGSALMQMQEMPSSVSHLFDENDPNTKASMLIGAVSLRAWIYKGSADFQARGTITYEDVWKNTKLQGLASKCDEVVRALAPETDGKFVKVDLNEMHTNHKDLLDKGVNEHIVVTGLNAVGKTTILKAFSRFIAECGINSQVVKMPRPDGPLSKVILPALAGELNIKNSALQMAFIADALDFDPEPETLIVFDRHPMASEALVYGPEEIVRTVLAANEIKKQVFQTFIIDRHPVSCDIEIAKRLSKPRIFEDNIEKMTEQLIRFSRLTALPGMHWINNDIPTTGKYTEAHPKDISIERFIGAVHFSGILQRNLIRQGRFNNYADASKFVYQMSEPYRYW